MTDIDFSRLMEMKKRMVDNTINLPRSGEVARQIRARSVTSEDEFFIDIDRRSSQFRLSKKKLQERVAATQELMIRVEIDSRPHQNPDGQLISGNHVHVFREGYGLSFAYELDTFENGIFANAADFYGLFDAFCTYCNIDLHGTTIQGVI